MLIFWRLKMRPIFTRKKAYIFVQSKPDSNPERIFRCIFYYTFYSKPEIEVKQNVYAKISNFMNLLLLPHTDEWWWRTTVFLTNQRVFALIQGLREDCTLRDDTDIDVFEIFVRMFDFIANEAWDDKWRRFRIKSRSQFKLHKAVAFSNSNSHQFQNIFPIFYISTFAVFMQWTKVFDVSFKEYFPL